MFVIFCGTSLAQYLQAFVSKDAKAFYITKQVPIFMVLEPTAHYTMT